MLIGGRGGEKSETTWLPCHGEREKIPEKKSWTLKTRDGTARGGTKGGKGKCPVLIEEGGKKETRGFVCRGGGVSGRKKENTTCQQKGGKGREQNPAPNRDVLIAGRQTNMDGDGKALYNICQRETERGGYIGVVGVEWGGGGGGACLSTIARRARSKGDYSIASTGWEGKERKRKRNASIHASYLRGGKTRGCEATLRAEKKTESVSLSKKKKRKGERK